MAVVGSLVLALGAVAPLTLAGVVVTAEETGGDVVFAGGGSLDLSAWEPWDIGVSESVFLRPDIGASFGATPASFIFYWDAPGFSGPETIGPGTEKIYADSGTGDLFYFSWGGRTSAVPYGYESGDMLGDSTAVYEGHTFESLGVTPGTYTWTWDTAAGGTDFFTINIVPEPSMLALAMLYAAGVAGLRRRQS
jgi:hypothetical protein